MKTRLLVWLGMLACVLVPMAHAVEIMHWERLPLAVPLQVGEERIVFVDRNVRVGVPTSVGDRLRVQSAGGAIYLRASEPIEPTRLQLQDADSGALILLDIAAEPAQDGEPPLEPVRIVEGNATPQRYGQAQAPGTAAPAPDPARSPRRETPVAVAACAALLAMHAPRPNQEALETQPRTSGTARKPDPATLYNCTNRSNSARYHVPRATSLTKLRAPMGLKRQ